jgi:hypothetical protein
MISYRQNYAALVHIPQPKMRERRPILSIRDRRRVPKRFRPLDAPTGTTRPALDLTPRIDRLAFLYDLTDTQIGREAIKDPNFIHDIRAGRRLREQTRARLVAYLDSIERGEG